MRLKMKINLIICVLSLSISDSAFVEDMEMKTTTNLKIWLGISIILLSGRAGADLTVYEFVEDEKVVYDSDTGKYWYWNLTDFTNMTTAEQITAIAGLNATVYGGISGGWHMATETEIRGLFEITANDSGYDDFELPWWWYESHGNDPDLREIAQNFEPTDDGVWLGRVDWWYEWQPFPWDPPEIYYETVKLVDAVTLWCSHASYPEDYAAPDLGAWITTDTAPTVIPSYELVWFASGGGGTSSGGAYQATFTIGQADVDWGLSETYQFYGGFWPGGPVFRIEFEDFAKFTGNWLRDDCTEANEWCEGADLDQSGDVGIEDFVLIVNLWMESNPFRWPLR